MPEMNPNGKTLILQPVNTGPFNGTLGLFASPDAPAAYDHLGMLRIGDREVNAHQLAEFVRERGRHVVPSPEDVTVTRFIGMPEAGRQIGGTKKPSRDRGNDGLEKPDDVGDDQGFGAD